MSFSHKISLTLIAVEMLVLAIQILIDTWK
jgi:hypothetical protein